MTFTNPDLWLPGGKRHPIPHGLREPDLEEKTPMKMRLFLLRTSLLATLLALCPAFLQADSSFIGGLTRIRKVTSTVPANGDVNPYGVAVVPATIGGLIQGHVLVSNFNAVSNLQGTGTTIMDIAPDGTTRQFAQINAASLPGPCPGGVGLTTALVVLRTGWVIVGSLPTSNGMSATAKAGCLLVLNGQGQVVETFSGAAQGVSINGPWDMTVFDLGAVAELFVTNVLNGTVKANGAVVNRGTVVRIVLTIAGGSMPKEIQRTIVGSGFPEKSDPNALVIGPTGLGLGADGTLYVADTVSSRIAAIPNALMRGGSSGSGMTVSSGGALNGPLGLAIAPNGDILTVNAGDGNIVETTPTGTQVAVKGIDTSGLGAGTLFGLAVTPNKKGVYFVDDGDNTLDLLH